MNAGLYSFFFVFYSWVLSNCSKQKKNKKINFLTGLYGNHFTFTIFIIFFCLFVVGPWANSSKCGRCWKSRLLFGKPLFKMCCFHIAQIALDPHPPSSVTHLKQEIARFFSSKRVLAYTKQYNTCSTRFVPLPIYGFLANTFIPIVIWVYLYLT